MSWDVIVYNFGGSPKPVEQLTTADPQSLGTPAHIRQAIDKHLPGIDWSDPTWGIYDADEFSLEFNLADEPEKTCFMIHVRGGGRRAVDCLVKFAKPNKWSILDITTCKWLNNEEPSTAGWNQFQKFRDSAMKRDNSNPENDM